MITLLPGHAASSTNELLNSTLTGIKNVQGSGFGVESKFTSYLNWAIQASDLLSQQISAGDVERLVTTKRYWAIQNSNPFSNALMLHLINIEVSERIRDFEREVAEFKLEIQNWDKSQFTAIVLDTNVWLEHYQEFPNFKWLSDLPLYLGTALVFPIPMKVVDELDVLKKSRTQDINGKMALRTKAQGALIAIEKSISKPGEWVALNNSETEKTINQGESYVYVIKDSPTHLAIRIADAEIIDRASALQSFAKDTYVIAYDTGFVFRANQAGLKTHKLEYPIEEANNSNAKKSNLHRVREAQPPNQPLN
jgi:rRNA-processing protein FCF1